MSDQIYLCREILVAVTGFTVVTKKFCPVDDFVDISGEIRFDQLQRLSPVISKRINWHRLICLRSKVMAYFRDDFAINEGEYLICIHPRRLDQLIAHVRWMQCDPPV